MRVSFKIPDALGSVLDREAERLGISRSELCRQAIAKYAKRVKRREDKEITERLNRLFEEHPELNRLDPILEEMQRRSLLKEGPW